MITALSIYLGIALGIFCFNRFQGFQDGQIKWMIIGICLLWPLALLTLAGVWLVTYFEKDVSI